MSGEAPLELPALPEDWSEAGLRNVLRLRQLLAEASEPPPLEGEDVTDSQRPKRRSVLRGAKRKPLANELCLESGKQCWTRDAARSQARYLNKRDSQADPTQWYRCPTCSWWHLGHGSP